MFWNKILYLNELDYYVLWIDKRWIIVSFKKVVRHFRLLFPANTLWYFKKIIKVIRDRMLIFIGLVLWPPCRLWRFLKVERFWKSRKGFRNFQLPYIALIFTFAKLARFSRLTQFITHIALIFPPRFGQTLYLLWFSYLSLFKKL